MTITKRADGLYWPDSDIDSCYVWTNTELYTTKQIIEAVNRSRNIIHAGGNVGAYTIEFAKAFEAVYVFEPDATNFKCLCKNTEEFENVFPFRAVLGNEPKQVNIENDNPENCGTFRVVGKGRVPTVTIDSLELNEVDCIHLDIEGYEMNALLGATKTIQRCNPLVVVEWLEHGSNYGWSKENIVDFLTKMGYNKMKQIGSDMMFKNEN